MRWRVTEKCNFPFNVFSKKYWDLLKNNEPMIEAIVQRCSVKKLFLTPSRPNPGQKEKIKLNF